MTDGARVAIANAKAKSVDEIRCGARGKKGLNGKAVKCPPFLGGNRNKYKGIHKCWSCSVATWSQGSLKGQAYGPRRRSHFLNPGAQDRVVRTNETITR